MKPDCESSNNWVNLRSAVVNCSCCLKSDDWIRKSSSLSVKIKSIEFCWRNNPLLAPIKYERTFVLFNKSREWIDKYGWRRWF